MERSLRRDAANSDSVETRHGTETWAETETETETERLPAWPVTALFGFYPVWWALGVVDIIWAPAAAVMAYLLIRSGRTRLPWGFGVWLLFLLWALCSIIELQTASSVIGFAYRMLMYVSATGILVYVYNARRVLTERYVTGVMTAFWLTTVVGGYLGVLLPDARFQTVLSRLLAIRRIGDLVPGIVLNNQLVRQMIVRRFAQFNPDAYSVVSPRPSAPFLYTNNWGNAYSLLIPFVVVYLMHLGFRGTRFWLLVVALLASIVPAFLTLNRGMFLGLGIALLYVAVRLALVGKGRGLMLLLVVGLVAGAAWTLLPIQARLDQRLQSSTSSSTDTRASLYAEVLDTIPMSPFFGEGSPRQSANRYAPPVGTQGQLWLVLYSHGVGGALLFVGWFVLTFLVCIRRRDPGGLAWNTVMLVATVELTYYGSVPSGLPLVMVAAGLALRGPDDASPSPTDATGLPVARPRVGSITVG